MAPRYDLNSKYGKDLTLTREIVNPEYGTKFILFVLEEYGQAKIPTVKHRILQLVFFQ